SAGRGKRSNLRPSSDTEPQRPEGGLIDPGAFRGPAGRRLEAIQLDNHPALELTLPQTRRDGGKVHHAAADFAEAELQFFRRITILASEFVSVPPNVFEVHQNKPLMIGSD